MLALKLKKPIQTYRLLAVCGTSVHLTALFITLELIALGAGVEANPLYQIIGPTFFFPVIAVVVPLVYLLLWKTRRLTIDDKILFALLFTAVLLPDMTHDVSLLLRTIHYFPLIPP